MRVRPIVTEPLPRCHICAIASTCDLSAQHTRITRLTLIFNGTGSVTALPPRAPNNVHVGSGMHLMVLCSLILVFTLDNEVYSLKILSFS